MNKSILIVIIVAVVFAGAGFYGGMLYGNSKNSVALSSVANRPSGPGSAQSGATGGNAYGEIVSVDTSSMTVKASDGGSKIVFISESAKITKNADVQSSDLTVGQTVMASGSTNSDGSITAKTIEINPQTRANMQSGKSNSVNTNASATQTQDSDSNSGDMGGMPPMDDNGAGGPPPGM